MISETILVICAAVTAVVVVLNLGWTIYWSVLIAAQAKAARNDERFKDHADRIKALEGTAERLPTHVASHEDTQALHNRISAVRRELGQDLDKVWDELSGVGKSASAIEASVKSIENNLRLLNQSEFLKSGGK